MKDKKLSICLFKPGYAISDCLLMGWIFIEGGGEARLTCNLRDL